MKLFLTNLVALLLCSSVFAGPVKKHRDQLRFGYGFVESTEVYEVGADGSSTHVRTDVNCRESGSQRCRASSIVYVDPTNELDVFGSQYTAAEAAAAEDVLVAGDGDIESGILSGTESETVQFINVETGVSYSRTFTYSWSTNTDNTIDSELSVSDQF